MAIHVHRSLIEMGPKKWAKQAASLFFRERNKLWGMGRTKKLRFLVVS